MQTKSQKNKIIAFKKYLDETGINDELVLYIALRNTVESYFNKSVYIDSNLELRFFENDKKISISKELSHLLVKSLIKIKKRKQDASSAANYSFLNRVIIAKVIKITRNGYLLVDDYGNNCFLPRSKSYIFETGSRSYFFCHKIERGVLKLKVNNAVAEYVINSLLPEKIGVFVEKWICGKLLVFSYGGKKLGRDNLNRLKYFFKEEKIIFNQRTIINGS